MAGPYFWVGGSGNWSDATHHWAASSGGAPNAANTPTSADNVSFDANSNATAYTVTLDVDANCASMTWALPGTSGVPTFTGSAFTLKVFGSLTLVAGQTFSPGALQFKATATGKTITTAGVSIASNITFDGVGGGWTLQDAWTSPSNRGMTVNNGTLNTNGGTGGITVGTFTSTSGVRTLTFDNSTINIIGPSGTVLNFSTSGTLTFSATGSTFNLSGGTANTTMNFNCAGLTYGTINITGAGLWNIDNASTYSHFSYTSTTDKRDSLSLNSATPITIAAAGSLTIAGNSVVNRAFIISNSLGTQRHISVPSGATVTLTNVDFQDLAPTGTFGTWTGTSLGDALGNSGITFDASVTLTYLGGTHNWSDGAAAWSGTTNRTPLPQDDVVVNTTTAGTLTADTPRLGRNLNFTSFTRSFQLGSQTAVFFGNLTLSASMTFGGGQIFQAMGRGAQTITSNGIGTPSTFEISAFGGTYTFQDAYTSTTLLSLDSGSTVDSQGFNVSALRITPQATIKATSASIWSASATSGTPWNANASTDTTNFFATIKLTGAITSATFAGAGKTYNNLWWSNTSATGTLIITGANTFANFRFDSTTARTIQFPNGSTQTIASVTQDNATAGQAITIKSASAGNAATWSVAGGNVSILYGTIQDMTATGGATFRDVHGIGGAGSDGNVSGNTGWTFGAVSVTNSASLAAATIETGSPAKNAKPSVSLLCATIAQGIVVKNAKPSGVLAGAALAAGSLISGKRVSGSLLTGVVETGSLVRGMHASGSFAGSAAETGSAARNLKPSGALASNAAETGSAHQSALSSAALATGVIEAGHAATGHPAAGLLAARSAQSAIVVYGARPIGPLGAAAGNSGFVSARDIRPAVRLSVGASLIGTLRRSTSAAALLAVCPALKADGDVIHEAVSLVGRAESPVSLIGHAESPITLIGVP